MTGFFSLYATTPQGLAISPVRSTDNEGQMHERSLKVSTEDTSGCLRLLRADLVPADATWTA